jgi:hypothetical protein
MLATMEGVKNSDIYRLLRASTLYDCPFSPVLSVLAARIYAPSEISDQLGCNTLCSLRVILERKVPDLIRYSLPCCLYLF